MKLKTFLSGILLASISYGAEDYGIDSPLNEQVCRRKLSCWIQLDDLIERIGEDPQAREEVLEKLWNGQIEPYYIKKINVEKLLGLEEGKKVAELGFADFETFSEKQLFAILRSIKADAWPRDFYSFVYAKAKKDIPYAQHFLGIIYGSQSILSMGSYGSILDQSITNAIKWFSKASDQGYGPAQFALSIYIMSEDSYENKDWFRKLYDNGLVELLNNPIKSIQAELKYKRSLPSLQKTYANLALESFNGGHLPALLSIYRCKKEGIGVDQDFEAALECLPGGSNSNSDFHFFDFILGKLYECAPGIPQNLEKALVLYRSASEKGFPISQHHLAASFFKETSLGGLITFEEARKWLYVAAEQGVAEAQKMMGDLLTRGGALIKGENVKEAFEWYLKAAENGNYEAQVNLFQMYSAGIGTDRNVPRAEYWEFEMNDNSSKIITEYTAAANDIKEIQMKDAEFQRAFERKMLSQ